MQERYDVVVIGAGHAGCEAARACARIGLKTAMVTMNLDLIAQMSCNPAVGGIAKGHLVREIDALGGEMGRTTDRAAIQMKTLNASRGPAVRSTRAQCDRARYRTAMKQTVEAEPNISATATMTRSLLNIVILLEIRRCQGDPMMRAVIPDRSRIKHSFTLF